MCSGRCSVWRLSATAGTRSEPSALERTPRAARRPDSPLGPLAHCAPIQVNEAFKDLSAIVDEQGHAIEQIEVNVIDAHVNTEKGVGFLQVRRARRRAWIVTGRPPRSARGPQRSSLAGGGVSLGGPDLRV